MFQWLFSNFQGWNYAWGRDSRGARFYDALKDTGRRRSRPSPRIYRQEHKTYDRDRRALSAKAADVIDNFALAAWMVNVHINHISSLEFRATTKNRGFDNELERWFTRWSNRFNCHTQQKHSFRTLVRLIEGRRLADGDVFILKVGGDPGFDGRGSIQIIEADRIATPEENKVQRNANQFTRQKWHDGVELDALGRAKSYAVHDRTEDGGLIHTGSLKARNVLHHGFFQRPDQIRGMSPLIQSLNLLQDVMEGQDYAMQKLKLSKLFAAVITRAGTYPMTDERNPFKQDKDEDGYRESDPGWDLESGPQVFDLEENQDVKVIQDAAQTSEGLVLLNALAQVAMKSIDIPYSFYSEDHTNWFGQRSAHMAFEKAARPKRRDLIEVLDQIVAWRLGMSLTDGDISLPSGMAFEDVTWEFIPEGLGWWDPVKEVTAARASVSAGFESPIDVCKRIGTDWEKNLEDRKRYEDRAEELDLVVDFAMGSSSSRALPEEPGEEEEEPVAVGAPEEDEEDTDE